MINCRAQEHILENVKFTTYWVRLRFFKSQNDLFCGNAAQNLYDVEQVDVFADATNDTGTVYVNHKSPIEPTVMQKLRI